MATDGVQSLAIDRNDLIIAFDRMRRIRDAKRSVLPFVKQRLDYDLLIFVGEQQLLDAPPNMNSILSRGFGSPSTVIRRITSLEQAGILEKHRSSADRRNVLYKLQEAPLHRVQIFLTMLLEVFSHA